MISLTIAIYFMAIGVLEAGIYVSIMVAFGRTRLALLVSIAVLCVLRGAMEGFLIRLILHHCFRLFHLTPPRAVMEMHIGSNGVAARNRPYTYILELHRLFTGMIAETLLPSMHESVTDQSTQTTAVETASHRNSHSTLVPILSRLSHELNTSLEAILGGAQILTQYQTFSVEQRQLVDIILHCGKVMANQVNDFLDLAQCQQNQLTLSRKVFSLSGVVSKVKQAFEGEANRLHITLDIAEPNVSTFLIGDRGRLEQILTNLMCNAVQSFENDGNLTKNRVHRITLTVQETPGESGKVSFTLSDNGCGIPDQEQANLFIPFYQLPSAGGTNALTSPRIGLGLCICRYLVRMMGGEIEVFSDVGEGTTVNFFLRLDFATSWADIEQSNSYVAIDLRARMSRFPVAITASRPKSLRTSSSYNSMHLPNTARRNPSGSTGSTPRSVSAARRGLPSSLITQRSPTASKIGNTWVNRDVTFSLHGNIPLEESIMAPTTTVFASASRLPETTVPTATASVAFNAGSLGSELQHGANSRESHGHSTSTSSSNLENSEGSVPESKFNLDQSSYADSSPSVEATLFSSLQHLALNGGSVESATATAAAASAATGLSGLRPTRAVTSGTIGFTHEVTFDRKPPEVCGGPLQPSPSFQALGLGSEEKILQSYANLTAIRRSMFSVSPSMSEMLTARSYYTPFLPPSEVLPGALPTPSSLPSPISHAPSSICHVHIPLVIFIVDDNAINRMLLKRMITILFSCECVCFEKASCLLEDVKRRTLMGQSDQAMGANESSTSLIGTNSRKGSESLSLPKFAELRVNVAVRGVVLTDIHMPEIDGLELTQRLRELYTEEVLPIVGVTADRTAGLLEQCLDVGMQATLTKPVLKEYLRNSVVGVMSVAWGDDDAEAYCREITLM